MKCGRFVAAENESEDNGSCHEDGVCVGRLAMGTSLGHATANLSSSIFIPAFSACDLNYIQRMQILIL